MGEMMPLEFSAGGTQVGFYLMKRKLDVELKNPRPQYRSSLVGQWLILHTAEDVGSVIGWGTRIRQAM